MESRRNLDLQQLELDSEEAKSIHLGNFNQDS